MADPVVLDPGEGERLAVGTSSAVFKATKEATAGTFSLSEVTIAPATTGPPPHLHRKTVDSFYVLEGSLAVLVGEEWIEARPGSYVCVPPGIVHTFANRGGESARFLNLNSPAGWEDYIRDMAAAMPEDGPPDPQVMAEIASRYDFVFPPT